MKFRSRKIKTHGISKQNKQLNRSIIGLKNYPNIWPKATLPRIYNGRLLRAFLMTFVKPRKQTIHFKFTERFEFKKNDQSA